MSVLYSLRMPHKVSASEAFSWFQKSVFTDTPPYFLTHWKTGKKFFHASGALIAYEETSQHLVVAGQPLVAAGSTDRVLYESFREFARRKKKTICGYYVGRKWGWDSFYKVPIGTSVRVFLDEFDMESPRANQVRRAWRKGLERGYDVLSIPEDQRVDNRQVKGLFSKWRSSKSILNFKFFLSSPGFHCFVNPYEQWFILKKDGNCLAFCSLLPYLVNGRYGFYMDHLIYDPTKEGHALSHLISFLIKALKRVGIVELNLGLNPFAQVDRKHPMGRFFNFLYNIPFLYRPKGLHFFKSKFAGIEEREYCFFQNQKNQWPGLFDMAKVTLMGSGKQKNQEMTHFL